jgi:hypothetical protein
LYEFEQTDAATTTMTAAPHAKTKTTEDDTGSCKNEDSKEDININHEDSDSAQLTSFGSASVWPVYLMFANQSKQERMKPSCHMVHHLAYVPSVGPNMTNRQCIALIFIAAQQRLYQPVSRKDKVSTKGGS